MVVRVFRQLDAAHILIDGGCPLVRFAPDEAVELVEARAGWPAVGGAGRADFPGGGLVRLAEGGRTIAVESKHFRERSHRVGPLPGLTGKGSCGLGNRAHVADMMVAAGQQRCAGRRAKSRRVEVVVAKPAFRQTLQRRHLDRAAERAGLSKAHVVDQDDEHVGCPPGRFYLEPRRGFGVTGIEFGDRGDFRLWNRQDPAIERGRRGFVIRSQRCHLRERGSIEAKVARRCDVAEPAAQQHRDDADMASWDHRCGPLLGLSINRGFPALRRRPTWIVPTRSH